MYFVIRNSSGDTYVETISKETLTERLNENYWGSDVIFLDKAPREDTNYWGESVLIIKGDIVVPREVNVVTEFEVD